MESSQPSYHFIGNINTTEYQSESIQLSEKQVIINSCSPIYHGISTATLEACHLATTIIFYHCSNAKQVSVMTITCQVHELCHQLEQM